MKMVYALTLPLILCVAIGTIEAYAGGGKADCILWYAKPAQNWENEALPIGNGRLGCMIFGGVSQEHIQFNEDSLWLGDEKDTGSYQAFGDLYIEMAHQEYTAYRRELDIGKAVHAISYKSGGIQYKREYFSSYPAQVMVFRFSSDKHGAYTGKIILTDAHGAMIRTEGDTIISSGSLKGYTYQDKGRSYDFYLDYESQIRVLHSGGSLTADDTGISFKNCDELIILLAADTNYLNQRDKGWKGEHPHNRLASQLAAASGKRYQDLLNEHIHDYQSLFTRLTLNVGETPASTLRLPTNERMDSYRGKKSKYRQKCNTKLRLWNSKAGRIPILKSLCSSMPVIS